MTTLTLTNKELADVTLDTYAGKTQKFLKYFFWENTDLYSASEKVPASFIFLRSSALDLLSFLFCQSQ